MRSGEEYGRQETRDRILAAAARLIEESGADTTMAQVAAEAGVSRQAVYLHVSNRSGLLVGVIDHMNRTLGLSDALRNVHGANSGRESLEAMIALHASFSKAIFGITRALDAARHHDPEVAAAWDDRMALRWEDHRRIIQRIADEGDLAPGWTVESATDLFYTSTLPWAWDELVIGRGWSLDRYRDEMTRLLSRAFLRDP